MRDDLLANPGDRLVPTTPAAAPVGPYPVLAADSTGTTVPIVTTQGEYRYLGRLTVDFDAAGRLVSTDATKSGPIRIVADQAQPDYVAEDPTMKTRITDPLVAYKASLAANVIGTSAVNLDGGNPNPIRLQESNLGNLVADGFLAGVNRTAAADGRPRRATSRSPTAAASALDRGRAHHREAARSTCCRSTTCSSRCRTSRRRSSRT